METNNYLETLIHFRFEPEYWTKKYYGKYKQYEFFLTHSSSKYTDTFPEDFEIDWWMKKKLIPKEVLAKKPEIIQFFKDNILKNE